jgi:hypothetical protein
MKTNLSPSPRCFAALLRQAAGTAGQARDAPGRVQRDRLVRAVERALVTQGEAQPSSLEGPEEGARADRDVVEGAACKIKVASAREWDSKVNVYVTARRIEALAISGSGDISAPALTGEALKLSISGSGDMRIGGKVDGLTASIAGLGRHPRGRPRRATRERLDRGLGRCDRARAPGALRERRRLGRRALLRRSHGREDHPGLGQRAPLGGAAS